MKLRPCFSGVLLLAALGASAAHAQTFESERFGAGPFYQPRVPVSALAHPAAWFDPSRLQITSSISVGTGFGGGTSGLQVTSLSYRFGAPLAMRVSLGNAFGSGTNAGGRSFFLEGVDLAYRPFGSLLVNVQYRDVRSPLQLSRYPSNGFWGW